MSVKVLVPNLDQQIPISINEWLDRVVDTAIFAFENGKRCAPSVAISPPGSGKTAGAQYFFKERNITLHTLNFGTMNIEHATGIPGYANTEKTKLNPELQKILDQLTINEAQFLQFTFNEFDKLFHKIIAETNGTSPAFILLDDFHYASSTILKALTYILSQNETMNMIVPKNVFFIGTMNNSVSSGGSIPLTTIANRVNYVKVVPDVDAWAVYASDIGVSWITIGFAQYVDKMLVIDNESAGPFLSIRSLTNMDDMIQYFLRKMKNWSDPKFIFSTKNNAIGYIGETAANKLAEYLTCGIKYPIKEALEGKAQLNFPDDQSELYIIAIIMANTYLELASAEHLKKNHTVTKNMITLLKTLADKNPSFVQYILKNINTQSAEKSSDKTDTRHLSKKDLLITIANTNELNHLLISATTEAFANLNN